MNRKRLLAGLLNTAKIFDLASFIIGNQTVQVFNFHRVYAPPLDTPFDKGVFDHSTVEFEKQLLLIKKYFDVLSEDDIIDLTQQNKLPPKRSAIITFDDGYIDNFTLAMPLLQKHALPAIYFIPIKPIMDRKLGWWDLTSYLIYKSQQETIRILDNTLPITTEEERAEAVYVSLQAFKLKPAESTKDLILELSESTKVELPSNEEQSQQLMSWEQIKQLKDANIAVGSHTVSHRVLATLSKEEQRNELIDSKRILEEKIGHEVRSLSYPVGGPSHFTDTTKLLAKEAGYLNAYSYNTGFNHTKIDPYNIRRITLSNYEPLMKGQMLVPSVFA